VWRKRLTGRPDSADYEAVNPNLFARAMIHVPRDAFIDLGCGKGRALILAYQAGFRDLIGVEISPSLARAALRNTRKLGIAASIVESDVADFDLPDRDLVAFMYNPFGPPTMQAVLEKLRSHRHSIHLIYINPQHGSLFADLQQLYADGAVIVLSNCVKSNHVQLPA
jgi:predicted RNA methylase